jgi:hypothetical protein
VSWYPAGLPEPLVKLARAIDQRFQLARPNGPVRIPAYTTAELQQIIPTDYMTAFDKTAGKPVFSKLSGLVFVWVYADGTAV